MVELMGGDECSGCFDWRMYSSWMSSWMRWMRCGQSRGPHTLFLMGSSHFDKMIQRKHADSCIKMVYIVEEQTRSTVFTKWEISVYCPSIGCLAIKLDLIELMSLTSNSWSFVMISMYGLCDDHIAAYVEKGSVCCLLSSSLPPLPIIVVCHLLGNQALLLQKTHTTMQPRSHHFHGQVHGRNITHMVIAYMLVAGGIQR